MNEDRSYRILVVDDNPDNVDLLTQYLTGLGYEVIPAYDGEEAMMVAARLPVDLILLDVMMPKLSGFDVCRRLKSADETTFIPIVLVTVRDDTQSKLEGFAAGADDYITKPFDIEELSARVKSLLRIKTLQDELRAANARLAEMSVTDGLTGLFNHRYFVEQLQVEVSRAIRYNRPLAVIMLDIDHFKNVNDTYGHLFGDYVLRKISDVFQRMVRAGDTVARYGGEEFAILVTETEGAQALAERIRVAVEKADFLYEGQQTPVRVSAGVCQAKAGEVDDGNELLRVADEALYDAKEHGRNRVVVKVKESDGNGKN
ncbi:MAG: PleD family two-component system response regulator [Candidatus Lernaella stagnicola]|nr:PleD family two-component system response regulator [Candidatus Lernaella stagnicola]